MADKISDMTPRTEIFATGKSLDCGEATSSRDQLLSQQNSKPRGTNMSTQHSPQIKNENAIVFILNPEVVLGNVSTPKENIVIFTSVSVLDANLKSAARLVHGIGIRKTSVCSKNIATNSAAEDYKACRKFRLFVKDRTTNLHFLVDSGADCSIIPATSKK
ncbi:hypothetical protein TNCV_4096111 [Trichonephila clavipes]|nr:hypothetical protein TNCV_4096111 [Trichonephila clavipes]